MRGETIERDEKPALIAEAHSVETRTIHNYALTTLLKKKKGNFYFVLYLLFRIFLAQNCNVNLLSD